jgi:hypothetical protein
MRRRYSRYTQQIGFSVQPELYDELFNYCLKERLSMSALLRLMIGEYMKNHPLFNTTPDIAEGPTKNTSESSR